MQKGVRAPCFLYFQKTFTKKKKDLTMMSRRLTLNKKCVLRMRVQKKNVKAHA